MDERDASGGSSGSGDEMLQAKTSHTTLNIQTQNMGLQKHSQTCTHTEEAHYLGVVL